MALMHKIITADGVITGATEVQVTVDENGKGNTRTFNLKDPAVASFSLGSSVKVTLRVSDNNKIYVLGITANTSTEPKVKGTSTKSEQESVLKPIGKIEGAFYVDPTTMKILSAIDTIAKNSGMSKLIVVGPSGYGKTSLCEQFAKATGRRYLRMNCSVVRDPEEWFGIREAKDGSTLFSETDFSTTLRDGNAVIVLDEVSRLEPWLLNSLFPILDDDRKTRVHGKEFAAGHNIVVMMTANIGAQYTGTFALDEAFMNRSDATIMMGPMLSKHEVNVLIVRTGVDGVVATKIVDVINRFRELKIEADCSTRASLNIARLVATGLPLRLAFEVVIITRLDKESTLTKQAIDVVNSAIGVK